VKDYGRRIALLTIGVAALAIPGPAGAAVTIGSNLESAPTLPGLFCQNTPCTASHISLPAGSTAPGGLVAPIDGVVVRWRIKVENDVTPVALRITRPGIGAIRTGGGTGPTVTPSVNGISTYPIQLPIQEGDAVGIDCCHEGTLDAFSETTGANYSVWNPRLQDGAPFRVVSPIPQELLVNADIEPDCDGDGFGDETQDSNVSSCHPRALTLDAKETKVERGSKVRLSGRIVETRQEAAGCAANQAVELQRKKRKATTFTTFEQVQTDAAGNFSTKVKVKRTFKYRAQVPETDACGAQVSNTQKVKVKK
jgi:hypothetical protein